MRYYVTWKTTGYYRKDSLKLGGALSCQRMLAFLLRPVFPASRVQHISDLHSKFALGHTICGSMVDIQSAAAQIRRGKKKKKDREKPQGTNTMACPIT